jgi:hypothetical protein
MSHSWRLLREKWGASLTKPRFDPCAQPQYPVRAQDLLQREWLYIAAIEHFYRNSKQLDHAARAKAYCEAMKKVYDAYPNDHEAATFYALSLASQPADDTTFAHRKQAAAILEKLFVIEPDHPGVAHYLIHSYDKPQLAQLGIPAARRYAQIAPAAPHALHMPSHIFARVGLWQDDINSNLAFIAASRKTAAMDVGDEGHQFHAMDFLFYAYMQSGRESAARALMDELSKMPPMPDIYGMGFDPQISTEAELAALYPLEMCDWPRPRPCRRWSFPAQLKTRLSIGPRQWARLIFISRTKSAGPCCDRKDS